MSISLEFHQISIELNHQVHGKVFNEKVEPLASYRSIICHQIRYLSLKAAGYKLLDKVHVNTALPEIFAKKPLTPKLNRDFISVRIDCITPWSLAKTSTTGQVAAYFYHSQAIHNAFHYFDSTKKETCDLIHSVLPTKYAVHLVKMFQLILMSRDQSTNKISLQFWRYKCIPEFVSYSDRVAICCDNLRQ